MRTIFLVTLALILCGCGASTATPAPTPTSVPAPTSAPAASGARGFAHPPAMTIDKNATYNAVVATTDGTFTMHLLPKSAPVAVNSFVFLARHHFYNGIVFHRIISGFMVQTGDPTGTGTGGPGYTLPIEPVHQKYALGTVAMANTGQPHSNGSQFFIVVGPQGESLPPNYTIFGQVTSGMTVVQKIAATPVGPNSSTGEASSPLKTVKMTSIRIVQG